MSEVWLETEGPVRRLIMDAPDRRNALTREMLAELAAAVGQVAEDSAARAMVVSGAGSAFCAGADLSNLFGDPTRAVSVLRDELKGVYDAFLTIRRLGIPTVAAVNGPAVGAGANIAFCCDVIVAGPNARFGITFAEIGLHPGGGCTWFLTQAMGAQRAAAAILGGEMIGAEDAYRAGLVAKLADDPEALALALANRYATRDPGLTRDMLATIDAARTASLGQVIELESWAQASAVTKPAFQDFMTAFTKKSAREREQQQR